jgi:hypothetical protein
MHELHTRAREKLCRFSRSNGLPRIAPSAGNARDFTGETRDFSGGGQFLRFRR